MIRLPSALRFGLISISLLSGISSIAQSGSTPYDAVDPIIGTAGDGGVFPGASLPFGMVQWSPDTNSDGGYFHNQRQIYGFSLTHLSGAGCPLYGDFAVLPTLGELASSPGAGFAPYAAPFDRSNQQAHPGYYTVTLANGIGVHIAVTERAGIARFIFPKNRRSRVLVNAGSSANISSVQPAIAPDNQTYGDEIELKTNDSFSGSVRSGGFCGSHSSYKLYVAGRFQKPFESFATWQDNEVSRSSKKARGKRTGAWLDFGNQHEVLMKIGLSFVSEANAFANLDSEVPGWNFEQVHNNGRRTWSDLLDHISVEGGTSDERTIFYTGLYHSFLAPNLFSDRDGRYIGFDNKVHSLSGSRQREQYANFSDWDIYRNTVQLQALFEPARESDMMQSLVNDAVQSGWFPRWPAANDVTYVMGGDSPTIVLASAHAFGAQDFDVATALKYMVKAATEPGLGPHDKAERPFLADYLKLGYVPVEKDSTAASRTLEYANADFAIAQFAKAIGDRTHYKALMRQSENWNTLLDPETHWIRPRGSDGTWLSGFDPELSLPKRPNSKSTDQDGFEEGNTYQYSFMIPFDYPVLFSGVGGDGEVERRLDKFFSKLVCWGEPCFNMANEPDFVTPYAYVFAGMPWKTQEVVTRIENETFKNAPDGIPGNDDLGATSGVYVWNALGFYPAVPGISGVALGTPMFDRATLRLAGGRTLVVTRRGGGFYVQHVSLNGATYPNSWLPLAKLGRGVTQLQFDMDQQPNKRRGKAVIDRPPSFRNP